MQNEKYISIEYNKWETYYKPLERSYDTLTQEYNQLKKKSREEAIEEIYNRYNSEHNLLIIQRDEEGTYPGFYDKCYISSIGLTDGARKLADKMYEERMAKVPNWIKILFKL